MAIKKGLGRGFDALIPTELFDESFDPTADQDGQVSDLRSIKVGEIHTDPDQPRKQFSEETLAELTESIREHGIIQPIIVTPHRTGGYMIVAGERRYRAAVDAKLDKVPALVRTLGAQHKLELSLIENLQRENLNAIETATAYLKLRDQFNLTAEQIGQRVGGKSGVAVTNTMRLLRLPKEVKQAISDGKLTEGQARSLIGLDEALVLEILPKMIREQWSARRTEAMIAALKRGKSTKEKIIQTMPVMYEQEVERLGKKLGSKVGIKTTKRGSGTISIAFRNEDDFRRITELFS